MKKRILQVVFLLLVSSVSFASYKYCFILNNQYQKDVSYAITSTHCVPGGCTWEIFHLYSHSTEIPVNTLLSLPSNSSGNTPLRTWWVVSKHAKGPINSVFTIYDKDKNPICTDTVTALRYDVVQNVKLNTGANPSDLTCVATSYDGYKTLAIRQKAP